MASFLFPPTHRVAIRSPCDADAPQLRVDLNAQHALGQILDRRAWWTASARERVQWLNDLDALLVEENLQQVMSVWHESLAIDWGYLTQRVLDAAAMAMHSNDKRAAVDGIFTEMVDEIQSSAYFGLPNGDNERMDEDDASEARAGVPSHYKRENPFGQVAWFVSLLVMREQLLALAPDEATPATVARLLGAGPTCDNATTLARATSLVLSVCHATDVTRSITSLLPDCLSPDALVILRFYFSAIRSHVSETKDKVAHALERIMTHHVPLVTTASEDASIPMPGPVPLSWMSELLPSKFGSELVELQRVIARERKSLDDRGPVVPLVDPSLYCGIVGRTKCHATPPCDYETPAEQMRALMASPPNSVLAIGTRTYGFQWLPCEIEVDDQSGTACIRSYINNLHPATFADLYHSIERIFTHFVPLFERVLSTLEKYDATESAELDVDLGPPRRFLHGRQCQVVIRIAEIQLIPDTTNVAFRGDEWQCAGREAEHIIATGMYFYSVQNITSARFAYQRVVAHPNHVPDDDVALGLIYGLQSEDVLAQPLGHVTALEGRCVVFPNLYESKLEPFHLQDPTQPGSLGMLTFMVVAPMATPVCSTASVPPQQSHWLQQERDPLLRQLNLPETIESLVREFVLEGMTREEATRHRDKLEQRRLWPREDSDYLWFHKEKNYQNRYYM